MAAEETQHTHPPNDDKRPHKDAAPPPPHPRGRGRALCAVLVITLLLLGITALTLWLVYRPHLPKFKVVSAAVYQLNTSSPPFVSAAMQFTVVTRNPNKRVSIIYDPFSAYVTYKNVAVTQPVILPPLFQDTKSTVALSPLLGGSPVPMEPELGNALAMDEAYGVVGLSLVFTGKLRYKAGAIKSGRYGVYVACDLLVSLKSGFVGQLPLLASPPCRVYI